ncbi:flavoprotein [Actinomadura rudentiformis]|uniref:Flavoprotein n=1 Tax=Actinomadura rudentiformis TaxID=359158 RepID=A0A6H9YRF7_9ACTN|nr:flavoprotein [Actinomadura rudentiformis]KAB2350702.1 flavoprotein [Actinomadura rudentiformis]
MTKVLYAVACGAPATADLETFVRLAQAEGWHVRVIATPMGVKFLDVDRLAALTGPVRTDFRLPHETSNGLPPADAVVVAPATFNTINKWALGITDTVAVGMLCEHVGMGVPILAVPQVKAELASHVAFKPNLDALRSMGVHVLFDPAEPMPRWEDILTELSAILAG